MQILKFTKSQIAAYLGTTIEELNKELTPETKKTVEWKDGKKQSFTPRKTKLIAECWGSYKEVSMYLSGCIGLKNK